MCPDRTPRVIVGTRDVLAAALAAEVGALARTAGRLSLALPGGSVAESFCPALAAAGLDWRAIDLFWCDERAVPPDHADSNYRIAAEYLIDRVAIDPARVHRMRGEDQDLVRSASDYERELTAALGQPPRLDVALLGVGADGHVCSLFPGHPALAETSRLVAVVTDAPKPPEVRLTLTLPALAGALVIVAAFGPAKAPAIAEALSDPASTLPVALAVRGAREALFLLDASAAAELEP